VLISRSSGISYGYHRIKWKLIFFFSLWLGIRQLQCILLKVALILGVEIHEGVSFERLLPPPDEQSDESMYEES
jgi:hypothetical protein